jgi:hypothetical protein
MYPMSYVVQKLFNAVRNIGSNGSILHPAVRSTLDYKSVGGGL